MTYGWGMTPARARIGQMAWKTLLWPKGSRYVVSLKESVRKAEAWGKATTVRYTPKVRAIPRMLERS